MIIRHRPAALLAPHVETLWFMSREALPHGRERGLPSGRVDIVIPLLQDSIVRFDSVLASRPRHLRGAVVSGVHDRFVVRGMGGPSSVIGVHFQPGGAAAFFGGALGELRNQTVLLEDLWGPLARELRERLQAAPTVAQKLTILEQSLLSRLPAARPADTMVMQALHALSQDPSAVRIGALQRASGCRAQQFIRRFESVVGITPKRFARVLRFNALLSRLVSGGPRDWAQLAAEGGYCDQSHLNHEFKRLAGVTPAVYVPVGADRPTHVAIADAHNLPSWRKNLQYTVPPLG